MLGIKKLSVSVGTRPVLVDVDLSIAAGEVHALLGPNASGKTTLLMAILGMPGYVVTGGTIEFQGRDITGASLDERARLGIGMAFQKPPSVRGVKERQIVEICLGRADGGQVEQLAARLHFGALLDREVNRGFSGGETKRSEMLQLLAQDPLLALFDEPESGVDLDSIALVGRAMNEILGKSSPRRREKAGIVVTHTGHILEYLDADRAHILLDGRLVCAGDPRDLFEDIRARGYEECVRCRRA